MSDIASYQRYDHNSQTCMSTTAILVKAQSLSPEGSSNPPTRGTLKIPPQLRVQMAAFRPALRHGRGGVGPSGITCDCKLLRVGSTCRRVVRQVCTSPPNNHILAPACDCACGGCLLGTETPQSAAAGLTSTTGMSSVQPVGVRGMGVRASGRFALANVFR